MLLKTSSIALNYDIYDIYARNSQLTVYNLFFWLLFIPFHVYIMSVRYNLSFKQMHNTYKYFLLLILCFCFCFFVPYNLMKILHLSVESDTSWNVSRTCQYQP